MGFCQISTPAFCVGIYRDTQGSWGFATNILTSSIDNIAIYLSYVHKFAQSRFISNLDVVFWHLSSDKKLPTYIPFFRSIISQLWECED
jgi:hypothetical protein